MRNLLTANFCRLKKNKLFWIITVGIFFLIAYSVIQGSQLCFNQSFDRTLAYYYFNVLPFSGLIAALFIAMFLGTDYSDGTIRNKLITGNERGAVYFSDFLVCLAAVTAFFAAWFLGGLVGLPFYELGPGMIEKMIVAYFSTVTLAAIFTMVVHLCANKATGLAIAIALAFALLLAGNYFVNIHYEPELVYSGVSIDEAGVHYEDVIANPAYVSGKKRMIYELVSYVFPTGQQIWLADEEYVVEKPFLLTYISVFETTVTLILGYLLFRKKDLK